MYLKDIVDYKLLSEVFSADFNVFITEFAELRSLSPKMHEAPKMMSNLIVQLL